MTQLQVAVVQFASVYAAPDQNRAKISKLTASVAADIFVLPELCTTGYSLTKEEAHFLAESQQGETVQFFRQLSLGKNAIVIAGFLEKENDRLYNSCVFISPEQETPIFYRKTHLFYEEKNLFTAGDGPFPFLANMTKEVRIGGMICYDWRFPEITRLLALQGADIVVCPSNLVTSIWQTVMPARSIENKIFTLVANRCGKEKNLIFAGRSAIYDPFGNLVAEAGDDSEEVLLCTIDPMIARDKTINAYNDIFRDRRKELYTL